MLPYRDQSDWSQETIFKVVSLAGNLYIYIFYREDLRVLYKGLHIWLYKAKVLVESPKNKHLLKLFKQRDSTGNAEATRYPPGAVGDVRHSEAAMSAM